MTASTKHPPKRSQEERLTPEEASVMGFLRELEELAGTPAELGRLVGADKRTVDRWLEGKHLSRMVHAERLRELIEILRLARRAHGQFAIRWFATPNPHISNILPITLLADDGGRAVVRGLLESAVMGGVA